MSEKSWQELLCQQPVDEHVVKLVEAIRDNANNPDNASAQLNLISASKDIIPVRCFYFILETKLVVKPSWIWIVLTSKNIILVRCFDCIFE